jgi:hypothetical protein
VEDLELLEDVDLSSALVVKYLPGGDDCLQLVSELGPMI